MEQQKELTVVQTWAVPFLIAGERIAAPFRWLAVRAAALVVLSSKRIAGLVIHGTRSVKLSATALRIRLARRVAYMPHAAYEKMHLSLAQLEEQALHIASHLEDTEKRLKACLGVARTLQGLGRSAAGALTQALAAFAEQQFWSRQDRKEAATHYGATLAELAAKDGEHTIAFNAYTLTQQYGATLEGYFLQIRFAIMMSDVAEQVVPGDRPQWLGRALEVAITIRDRAQRMRSVGAVATKMVQVRIGPPTGYTWDAILRPSKDYGDYGIGTKEPVPETAELTDEDMDAAFTEHVA